MERSELLMGSTLPRRHDDVFFTSFHKECQQLRQQYAMRPGQAHLSALLRDLKNALDTEFELMPDIERRIAATKLASLNEGLKVEQACVTALQKYLFLVMLV